MPLPLSFQCPRLTDQIPEEVLLTERTARVYTIKERRPLCYDSDFLDVSQCFFVSPQKYLILEVSVHLAFFNTEKIKEITLELKPNTLTFPTFTSDPYFLKN